MNPHTDTGRISIGNAENFTGSPTRGWFVGGFLDHAAGARLTDNVEIKWGRHKAGEERPDVAASDGTASLAVLITGRFEIAFPGETPDRAVLANQGDYVLYGPGVPHGWRALTDSVLITIRWRTTARMPA